MIQNNTAEKPIPGEDDKSFGNAVLACASPGGGRQTEAGLVGGGRGAVGPPAC